MANLVKYSEELQKLSNLFTSEELQQLTQAPVEVQEVLDLTPVLHPKDAETYREAEERRLTLYRKRQEIKKRFKTTETKLKTASQKVREISELVITPLIEREEQQRELNRNYEQERDWQKTIRINTEEAYREYLAKHSKKYGKELVKPLHYEEALAKIQEFEKEKQKALTNYNNYWQAFQSKVLKANSSEEINELIIELSDLEKLDLDRFGHLREEALKKISYYRHELEYKLREAQQRELIERQREALLRQQAEQLYSTLELTVGTLDEILENTQDSSKLEQIETKLKNLSQQNYYHLKSNAEKLLKQLYEKLQEKRKILSNRDASKELLAKLKDDLAMFKVRLLDAYNLDDLNLVLSDMKAYKLTSNDEQILSFKESAFKELYSLYSNRKEELANKAKETKSEPSGKVMIDGKYYDEALIRELASYYQMDINRFYGLKQEQINRAIEKMQAEKAVEPMKIKEAKEQARQEILSLLESWFEKLFEAPKVQESLVKKIISLDDFISIVKKVYINKTQILKA